MDQCGNESNQVSFDCQYHKGSKPQLLYFNQSDQQNQGDIFLCNKCLNQKRYKQQNLDNYLFIDDLLYSSEKRILSNWPPLANQDLLFDINSILEDDTKCVNRQNEVILEYFDSLKYDINEHIDQVRKQMLIQCDKIPELEDSFINCYNKIAEKERIRELLISPQPDNQEVHTKMSEMFDLKRKQKQENEDILLKVYSPYLKQLSSFDQSNPNRFKETIISMIHSINFFPDLVDTQEDQSDTDSNMSKNTKLIKIYKNMNKKLEDIELSQSQKFLLELIKSPTNYLTEEFSEQIEQIIKQLSPFFEDLDMSNCTLQNKVSINFNWLRIEQIELIDKLVGKMKQIEYSDSISQAIYKHLPNTQLLLSFFDRKSEDFEKLKLILQHYPILELMKIDFTFVKSSFENSSINLEVENIENEAIKFSKKNTDCWSNTILSKFYLESQKTYKIKFEFQPFNVLNLYSYCIGLTSKGQTENLYFEKLSLCINNNGLLNTNRMDKLKQGDKNNFKNFLSYQLEVNLSKGIFEISDSVSYNNIIEIEDDKKEQLMSDTLFQIGFSIFHQNNALIIQSIEVINE